MLSESQIILDLFFIGFIFFTIYTIFSLLLNYLIKKKYPDIYEDLDNSQQGWNFDSTGIIVLGKILSKKELFSQDKKILIILYLTLAFLSLGIGVFIILLFNFIFSYIKQL